MSAPAEDLLNVRRYVPFNGQWLWGVVVYYLQPASVRRRHVAVDFPVKANPSALVRTAS